MQVMLGWLEWLVAEGQGTYVSRSEGSGGTPRPLELRGLAYRHWLRGACPKDLYCKDPPRVVLVRFFLCWVNTVEGELWHCAFGRFRQGHVFKLGLSF